MWRILLGIVFINIIIVITIIILCTFIIFFSFLLCPMSFPLHHQTHDFQEDRYCKGWIPTSCAENSIWIDPKPPYLELKIPWKRKDSPPTEVLVIFIFPFLAPVHMFWRQVYALHLTRQNHPAQQETTPSSNSKPYLSGASLALLLHVWFLR